MLGCLIGDHIRGRKQSSEGCVIMMAVADVILSKLVWEQLRSDEESDALYQSRFQYFISHSSYAHQSIKLGSWTMIAAIPIGFSAENIDEAKSEALRCARIMTNQPNKIKEAQMIASLIFLGKEGVSREAIAYFLKAEYQFNLDKSKTVFGKMVRNLIQASNFESYLMESCVSSRMASTLLCGGLAQAFLGPLPLSLVDETLDELNEDYKRIVLSFHKTYDLKF